MIKRDFHEWTLADAEQEVHNIVGQVRIKGKMQQAEFITGNGVIKTVAFNILKSYGLDPVIRWGNSGVIDVTIQ